MFEQSKKFCTKFTESDSFLYTRIIIVIIISQTKMFKFSIQCCVCVFNIFNVQLIDKNAATFPIPFYVKKNSICIDAEMKDSEFRKEVAHSTKNFIFQSINSYFRKLSSGFHGVCSSQLRLKRDRIRSDFSMEHVVFRVIKNRMERINIGTFPIAGKLARAWFCNINLTPVSSMQKKLFKSSPMSKSKLILTIMVRKNFREFSASLHTLHEFESIIA